MLHARSVGVQSLSGMQTMADEWLTVEEAARLSGYSIQYVRRLLRLGKIESRKFAIVWQVSKSALLVYVRESKKSEDKRRGPRGVYGT